MGGSSGSTGVGALTAAATDAPQAWAEDPPASPQGDSSASGETGAFGAAPEPLDGAPDAAQRAGATSGKSGISGKTWITGTNGSLTANPLLPY
jgi:hypothetical protein